VRRDLAWHSLESNQVGIDEFERWCKLTGSELMMAVNLGARGIAEVLDLL
jgi:alpha-L-arabinofuranosidase